MGKAKAKTENKAASKPKCFIIMPITVPDHLLKTYDDDENHFDQVLKNLIEPAVHLAEFEPIPPSSDGSKVIQRDIAEKLQKSDMVLCDMPALNPNVFFELGIRTALNKPICLIRDSDLPKLPFDTGLIGCLSYSSSPGWQLDSERKKLAKHITDTVNAREYKDGKNVWWQTMGVDYSAAIASSDDIATGMGYMTGELSARLDRIEKRLPLQDLNPTDAFKITSFQKNLFENLLRNKLHDCEISNIEWSGNDGRISVITKYKPNKEIRDELTNMGAAMSIKMRLFWRSTEGLLKPPNSET